MDVAIREFALFASIFLAQIFGQNTIFSTGPPLQELRLFSLFSLFSFFFSGAHKSLMTRPGAHHLLYRI